MKERKKKERNERKRKSWLKSCKGKEVGRLLSEKSTEFGITPQDGDRWRDLVLSVKNEVKKKYNEITGEMRDARRAERKRKDSISTRKREKRAR